MNSVHILSYGTMWQAVISCNSTYDSRFIYAVKTTKIYCRPSCKSKTPNLENVRFFNTPLEAEKEGYRACKRCQPQQNEISYDPYDQVISDTISILTKNYDKRLFLRELASQVGVSSYHLNRTFKDKEGVTPRLYIEKFRIDKAKELLLSTTSTNTEVCFQIGYESLSSFYKAFQKHVGYSPKEFRCRHNC
jgi:AraC family transcriptional regulator of adaptative response / methylphosphotriester-DNA alkyltransferase methyltransferase